MYPHTNRETSPPPPVRKGDVARLYQFFDESQFESYRRLGLHVVEEILRAPDGKTYEYALSEFVAAAEAYAKGHRLQ